MKLKNMEIVNFLNHAPGILATKIPLKLYTAVKINMEELRKPAETYTTLQADILNRYAKKDENGKPTLEDGEYAIDDREDYANEMKELLEVEIELPLQVVPQSLFERMDESDKFGALSGEEYTALSFMLNDE